ncbi:MAG: hypothetical protein AMXMBFR64_40960 [Myxococcales bacterium]
MLPSHRGAALLAALLLVVGPAAAARAAHDTPPGEPPPADAVPNGPQAPVLLRFVEAPYPEDERAAGRTATVELRLTIDETGAVTDAEVVTSAGPAFDTAAVAACRSFLFQPAMLEGEPIPVRILYRYAFTLKEQKPTVATFTGLVRGRQSGAPLGGVRVLVEGVEAVTTDAEGRFSVAAVPPGPRSVTLEGEGFTALRVEEAFVAGERLDVAYEVSLAETVMEGEGDDMEIVVVAPAVKREAASTQVVAEDALKIPGAQGDVLKVVESMPGVGRSSVGSGALVVWGASPEDTRVAVDGVPIPRLYHQGGLRSVVHSDLVESVELVPAAYGAAYGRGLGGLVKVGLRTFDDEGVHGSVAADVFDASAMLRGQVAEPLELAAAARVSYLDLLGGEVVDDDAQDYFPFPRYYDVQGRARVELGPGEHLEAVALVSSDTVRRGIPDPDPALVRSDERSLFFARTWLRYLGELGGGAEVRVTPWFGFDEAERVEKLGAVETRLASETLSFGLRTSWRGPLTPWLSAEVGLDAEVVSTKQSRRGSTGAPAREGDLRVFGQPPPNSIDADAWDTLLISAAPYVELDFSFLDGTLHVVPGLRLDPTVQAVDRVLPKQGDTPELGRFDEGFVAEPRLAVRWDALPELSVNTAVGLFSQAPLPGDLSAVFGNPALPAATAFHALLGFTLRPIELLSVELTGFYTESGGLAVRSELEFPPQAEALVPEGEGRAYGGQLLVRLDPVEGVFGWVSYSLIRAERRDSEDAAWRLFDYDQTHLLTAVVAWDVGLGFDVGLRARLASGFPRTPVIGAWEDLSAGVTQPLFGEHNSERVPLFFQLDLRGEKRFEIGETTLDVYLEVQNVTNQENPDEIVYSTDFTRRGTIRGLPILPVAGLKWAF